MANKSNTATSQAFIAKLPHILSLSSYFILAVSPALILQLNVMILLGAIHGWSIISRLVEKSSTQPTTLKEEAQQTIPPKVNPTLLNRLLSPCLNAVKSISNPIVRGISYTLNLIKSGFDLELFISVFSLGFPIMFFSTGLLPTIQVATLTSLVFGMIGMHEVIKNIFSDYSWIKQKASDFSKDED